MKVFPYKISQKMCFPTLQLTLCLLRPVVQTRLLKKAFHSHNERLLEIYCSVLLSVQSSFIILRV